MLKKVILILTGLIFILSALAKLFPIQSFELIIVSEGFADWSYVRYIAVLIISVELLLGTMLLFEIQVKRVALPAAFSLLLIFCIQLLYGIIANGTYDNCGCFGDALPMTPLEALIKNIVMLLLIAYAYKKSEKEEHLDLYKPVIFFAAVTASLIFVIPQNTLSDKSNNGNEINPVDSVASVDTLHSIPDSTEADTLQTTPPDTTVQMDSEPEEDKKPDTVTTLPDTAAIDNPPAGDTTAADTVSTKRNTSELPAPVVSEFSQFQQFSNGTVNLDEGEKIVCLFSLDCEHCQETAAAIADLQNKMELPPVYALFFGPEDMVEEFFYRSNSRFPFKLVPPEVFFPLLEKAPPRVVYLVNGNKAGDWSFGKFSSSELKSKVEQYR